MKIIDKIDQYLIDRESGRNRQSHYSSDASECVRKLYYKWTKEKITNPIEAGALWKMLTGNSLHDMIRSLMRDAGIELIDEIKDYYITEKLDYPIAYVIDGLYVNSDSRQIEGLEIKTSYGRGVKAIQMSGQPRESDMVQVMIYQHLARIKNFTLLYYGTDNGYRTEFTTEYTDGKMYIFSGGEKKPYNISFNDIITKLEKLEWHVKTRQIPEREYRAAIKYGEIKKDYQYNNVKYQSDWQCMYCQWANGCWTDELEKYKTSNNSETLEKENKDNEGE